jgi:hypothetical protein
MHSIGVAGSFSTVSIERNLVVATETRKPRQTMPASTYRLLIVPLRWAPLAGITVFNYIRLSS